MDGGRGWSGMGRRPKINIFICIFLVVCFVSGILIPQNLSFKSQHEDHYIKKKYHSLIIAETTPILFYYNYCQLFFISGALDSVKHGRHILSTYYVPGTMLSNKHMKMSMTPSLYVRAPGPAGRTGTYEKHDSKMGGVSQLT